MPNHSLKEIPNPRSAAKTFSVSLMSNTKWAKVFSELHKAQQNALEVSQAIIKFVHTEREQTITAPWYLGAQGYVDSLNFGPFKVKDIEWIEFPKIAHYKNPSPNGTGRVPDRTVEQDIEKLEERLQKLGKLPIERTERGLRIVGYKGLNGV